MLADPSSGRKLNKPHDPLGTDGQGLGGVENRKPFSVVRLQWRGSCIVDGARLICTDGRSEFGALLNLTGTSHGLGWPLHRIDFAAHLQLGDSAIASQPNQIAPPPPDKADWQLPHHPPITSSSPRVESRKACGGFRGKTKSGVSPRLVIFAAVA